MKWCVRPGRIYIKRRVIFAGVLSGLAGQRLFATIEPLFCTASCDLPHMMNDDQSDAFVNDSVIK